MCAITRSGFTPLRTSSLNPKLRQLSGSEVLHHRIAVGNQALHDRRRLGMLQVERDGTFVAPMNGPPQRRAVDLLAPLPHRIATRRLDLDDLSSEIGKQARTKWRPTK